MSHNVSNVVPISFVKVSPTFISTDLLTPTSPPRCTLPSVARCMRPPFTQWGVLPTVNGCDVRSHRHYGSQCINFQSSSFHRVNDQMLPVPLQSKAIHLKRLHQPCPQNHVYASHQSKFLVFPQQLPLTERAKVALHQLHTSHYCTTTYREQYKYYTAEKYPCKNVQPPTGNVSTSLKTNEPHNVPQLQLKQIDRGTQTEMSVNKLSQKVWEERFHPQKKEKKPIPNELSTLIMDSEDEDNNLDTMKHCVATQTPPFLPIQRPVYTHVYLPDVIDALSNQKPCGKDFSKRSTIIKFPPLPVNHLDWLTFKLQAHQRYNQAYPERIPDLNIVKRHGKKTTFFGVHTSVFRG